MMNVTNSSRFALLLFAGISQFFILGGAQATAILNVVSDEFTLDAQSVWGVDPMNPFPPQKPPGTVEVDRLTGTLLSDVSVTHEIGNISNVAGTATRISSTIYENAFDVHLHSNLELGSGLSRSAWNLRFDIAGAGALFSIVDDHSANRWSDYNDADLLDITSGILYQDFAYRSSFSLLDGHSYLLSAESVQAAPRTGASEFRVRFDNIHLHVPEPGTLALLLSGLSILGLRRKPKMPDHS